VLLKNNIRDHWWRNMVETRRSDPTASVDMVGIDTAIIQNPKTWVASGHVGGFSDPMVDDRETKQRYRADHVMVMVPKDGKGNASRSCRRAGGREKKIKREARRNPTDYEIVALTKLRSISTATSSPPRRKRRNADRAARVQPDVHHLRRRAAERGFQSLSRPETAQGIFLNFKNVVDTTRVKIPFGVAQIGKSVPQRSHAAKLHLPSREFEQMEMEWFCHPDEAAKWYDVLEGRADELVALAGREESNLRLRDHERTSSRTIRR
jgi:glycyl-tRNA synthetase